MRANIGCDNDGPTVAVSDDHALLWETSMNLSVRKPPTLLSSLIQIYLTDYEQMFGKFS